MILFFRLVELRRRCRLRKRWRAEADEYFRTCGRHPHPVLVASRQYSDAYVKRLIRRIMYSNINTPPTWKKRPQNYHFVEKSAASFRRLWWCTERTCSLNFFLSHSGKQNVFITLKNLLICPRHENKIFFFASKKKKEKNPCLLP